MEPQTPQTSDFSQLVESIGKIPVADEAVYRRFVFKTQIAERMKDCGFDDRFRMDGFSRILKDQQEVFSDTLALMNRSGSVVALCGPRGLGKTTIAAQIAARWFWEDWQSVFDKADGKTDFVTHRVVSYRKLAAVLGKLKALYGDFGAVGIESLESYRDHLATVDVQVFDELNECEDASKFKDKILTDIIDRRYASKRDTILITNQTPAEFQRTINPSILSRLNEHGAIIECDWPSFRDQ